MSKQFETPSRTSPKSSRRGCLCKDNTYSTKCCNGTLRAQGIGSTSAAGSTIEFFSQEDTYLILQENNQKILI